MWPIPGNETPEATGRPVIVAGMHRSGTGLLTRLLDDLGLFVGARLDSSHEALLFQHLNRFALEQAGARWDRPEPFEDLLSDDSIREPTVAHIGDFLASPRRLSYLGLRRALWSFDDLEAPWGFKDPRNTFTLPLWEDVFGEIQVVHIRRHGVDVARSLQARATERLENRTRWFERLSFLTWAYRPRDRYTDSARCLDLEGGLSLWREYLHEAEKHVDRVDSAVEVHYETLLSNPGTVLDVLVSALDLEAGPEEIREAAERVDRTRAFAYQSDPELVAFAEDNEDDLRRFGYSAKGFAPEV